MTPKAATKEIMMPINSKLSMDIQLPPSLGSFFIKNVFNQDNFFSVYGGYRSLLQKNQNMMASVEVHT
jgi:hypothetical protein